MAEYFSKEGLEELRKELEYLKLTERPRITKAIADAAAKGDLSENAEYDAAKDEQKMIESKIAQLEETYADARLIDESQVDDSKALALSTVHIKNHNTGKEQTYTLVSETEANIKEGKISLKSPIGQALFGKEEGDLVEAEVPAGKLKLEILKITRDNN